MFCLHSAWWMSLLHRCVAATARSPLLKNLMQFLGVLFTMYKDDIENFLSADKSTGEEVLFDLRRYAEQKKQDRKQVRPIFSLPAVGNIANCANTRLLLRRVSPLLADAVNCARLHVCRSDTAV